MEYRVPLNVIINVSNIEYFYLHTFSSCSFNATLMAKVIDTCWLIITCDETFFIHMHLLILLHKFKYSPMHGYGTYYAKYYVKLSWYIVFTTTLMSFIDRHILKLTKCGTCVSMYTKIWLTATENPLAETYLTM